MPEGCVFCAIIAGLEPAEVVVDYSNAIVIVPRNPCAEGHVLVIPKGHVDDALVDPIVTGATFARASEYADEFGGGDCNMIVNAGPLAGQTVNHLHVHVVPRRPGDGLQLPWGGVD